MTIAVRRPSLVQHGLATARLHKGDCEKDVEFIGEHTHLVSPSSRASCQVDRTANRLSIFSWVEDMQVYGSKFLAVIFVIEFLMKGFVGGGLLPMAEPYLYAAKNVPAPEMQMCTAVAALPWAMKPLIGMITDVQPICGFHKAPYILLTSAMGICALFVIGVMQPEQLTIPSLVLCTFLMALQIVTADILVQGKFSEKVQALASGGTNLIEYVWVTVTVGGLIATICSGFLIGFASYHLCYIISAIIAVSTFFVVFRGYLEEKQVSQEETNETFNRFYEQSQVCYLAVFTTIGALTLAAVAMGSQNARVTWAFSIGIAALVLAMFWLLLNPKIASIATFFFLQNMVNMSIQSSVFYFMTDESDKYPDGPHFSRFFFNTVLGSVPLLGHIAGMMAYYRLFHGWTYRQWLIMANFAYATVQGLNIIMYKRHVRAVGFSDEIFMVLSSTIIEFTNSWRWMPAFNAFTYLCPKGMEATVYGILMGSFNLAEGLSLSFGAWILSELGCRPAGNMHEQTEFENMWKASVWMSVIPICAAVTTSWLLPDAPQDITLISDEDYAVTDGCLLERWSKAK